jgi:hypothetical protein
MSGRVVRFPLPGAGDKGVMEPIDIEWVSTSWRTLPSGVIVKSHGEQALRVSPFGDWVLSLRDHDEEAWTHLSGGPETRLIDYLAKMAGVQFRERSRRIERTTHAFGAMLGLFLTLL